MESIAKAGEAHIPQKFPDILQCLETMCSLTTMVIQSQHSTINFLPDLRFVWLFDGRQAEVAVSIWDSYPPGVFQLVAGAADDINDMPFTTLIYAQIAEW